MTAEQIRLMSVIGVMAVSFVLLLLFWGLSVAVERVVGTGAPAPKPPVEATARGAGMASASSAAGTLVREAAAAGRARC
jgi:hypothetical protein